VVQAPAPERPIDGGLATGALIAHVLISKYPRSFSSQPEVEVMSRTLISFERD
jgi:transposase